MNHRSLVVAFLAFGLFGCQLVPGRSAEDVARAVAAADWERAEHVTLVFRDAGISPSVLRLAAGKPYRLTLLNAGVNNHYFNAPEFFAAIAAAKAEVPRYAEFKADLGDVVVEALAPFQARMRELEDDKAYTLDVLARGAELAESIAARTLAKVHERLGFVPRPR